MQRIPSCIDSNPPRQEFFYELQFSSIFNLILWLISFWFKTMYSITEVFIYSAIFKRNYLMKQKLKDFPPKHGTFLVFPWLCRSKKTVLVLLFRTSDHHTWEQHPQKTVKKPFGALRPFTQEPDGKKAAHKSLFSVCNLHHSAWCL